MPDCNTVNLQVQEKMRTLIKEGHKGQDLNNLLKIFYDQNSCKQPHSQAHLAHSQPHSHHPHQPQAHQAHQSHSQHPDSQHQDPHKDQHKVTETVIDNSSDRAVRFVMIILIFFLFLPIFGIGYWCSQLALNDKTRQSQQKKDIGNALFVISIMGFVGVPIGIILLFFIFFLVVVYNCFI